MLPPPDALFGLQVTTMFFINVLVTRWYVLPWLKAQSFEQALQPLLLIHATRVVGWSSSSKR